MKLDRERVFLFSFRPLPLLFLLCPLVVLNFFDIFTTRYALSQCVGLYEMNPLYFSDWFLYCKLAMPFFVYSVYCAACAVMPLLIIKKMCLYSFGGLIVFSFAVVLNNVIRICYPFG